MNVQLNLIKQLRAVSFTETVLYDTVMN